MAGRKNNDTLGDEIIISETVVTSARQIRVYDPRGDFLIEVPAGARMTFGYFNPAAGGERHNYDLGGRGGNTMKTTCLRIYEDTTDKRQLAAFLGVSGFRDTTAVKLTRLRQRVTIESNFEDDGVGTTQSAEKVQRALAAAVEDDELF